MGISGSGSPQSWKWKAGGCFFGNSSVFQVTYPRHLPPPAPVLSREHKLFCWSCYVSDTWVAHLESGCIWGKGLGGLAGAPWPPAVSHGCYLRPLEHSRRCSPRDLARGSERAGVGFPDRVSVARRLPPSEARYPCPLREPA